MTRDEAIATLETGLAHPPTMFYTRPAELAVATLTVIEYARRTDTLARIKLELEKPVGREEGWVNPEHFDPWEPFDHAFYGSYSSEFDDVAILVLNNILNKQFGQQHGEGVAHEMFREVLCTAGLCDYGTSPRGCFPDWDSGFAEVLPALLEKWQEYRRVTWGEDE